MAAIALDLLWISAAYVSAASSALGYAGRPRSFIS
jgi:hypothetical protein